MNRYKDQLKRRVSVLERDKTKRDDVDDEDSYEVSSQHDRPARKFIPLLIFAAVALFIIKEEVPAVSNAWERMVAPDKWIAKQTCQKAAIEQSENKQFARILKPGKVNKTSDGLYIDRIRIGVMGQSGDEESIQYSCYLDDAGKLVKLNRVDTTTPAPIVLDDEGRGRGEK